MKWSILFFLRVGFAARFAVAAATEEYREKLTPRPLVNDKIFLFSTLPRGAVPRDPSSSDTNNTCTLLTTTTLSVLNLRKFSFSSTLTPPLSTETLLELYIAGTLDKKTTQV
jgi:hypothetical protein